MRAEEEYRSVILQYPDSKLLKEAKQKLREVQEVLAQREYNIGRFYYLRQAYPASIARLQTLVDRYPLYSGADETLFLLGQTYEAEMAMIRANPKVTEGPKAKMIEEFERGAAAAYSKVITRYPAMDRALDAKARLEAMKLPVPRPTRAALELNKKEVASRREPSMMSNVMGPFNKHPDMGRATGFGDPTMVDPTPVNATDVVRRATLASGSGQSGANSSISGQVVNGTPAPNQAPPRSDDPVAPATDPATAVAPPAAPPEQAPAAGELTPNAAPDPNELKPNVAADPTALPPLQQNNEIANSDTTATAASSSATPKQEELVDISSSKKKKKGLKKLSPF
jgi:outer membrane protein assembly factor BamD